MVGVASIGRVVHYWTIEGEELIPNPALLLAAVDTSSLEAELVTGPRLYLHVFWVGAFGGTDRLWAEHSRTPMAGRWTWPDHA